MYTWKPKHWSGPNHRRAHAIGRDFEPDMGQSTRAQLWRALNYATRPRLQFYMLQALCEVSQFHASAKVRALRARGRKLAGLRT